MTLFRKNCQFKVIESHDLKNFKHMETTLDDANQDTTTTSSATNVLHWYFVTKIVLTYCEKNCSSDREKLLKFEAKGQEF